MTVLEGKALLDHGKAIARRYAARVGSDTAEELRAEAVMRALRSPPPDGRMEPWLERIYRNLLVDRWRRLHPTVDLAEVNTLGQGSTPEDDVIHRERRRVVRASLRTLAPDARRVLLSRFWAELDDERAATRFGISATTVRTRIHRALARLRLRLGELRVHLPALFGRLSGQLAAVGAAPAMVAALVVAVAAGRPEPAAALVAQPPAIRIVDRQPRVVTSKPTPAEVVTAVPARTVKKPTARTSPPAPPAIVVPPAIEVPAIEPVVSEILQPDGLDVFAEPENPEPPCLVEAPPTLIAQIEKMIEEQL